MSILVTGAGLIGSLTAKLLLARQDKVVLIDTVKPDTVQEGAIFEICDVSDISSLNEIICRHKVKKIIHTAAMLSTGIRRDPLSGINVNIMGTTNILELARRLGLQRLVCASSTTVAYNTFGEHENVSVLEDVPLKLISQRPASIYAATKLAGEHLALLYRDLYGVDVVSLRYGAVLGGSNENPTSIPGKLLAKLISTARTGSKIVLDDPLLLWGGREEFIDARDCAIANICALDATAPKLGVYNVANGHWFTLEEFVNTVTQFFPGLEVELPDNIITGFAGFSHKRPAPSCTKATENEINFKAVYSLKETMEHSISIF